MSNNKNKVMDYLQISSEEYNDKIFTTYYNWCQKYSNSPEKFQDTLADSAINQWFIIQYAKLELEFIQLVEHFPKQLNNAQFHYQNIVVEIFKIYPKPLIERPTKVINNFINVNRN